jgi:hypothetical protein
MKVKRSCLIHNGMEHVKNKIYRFVCIFCCTLVAEDSVTQSLYPLLRSTLIQLSLLSCPRGRKLHLTEILRSLGHPVNTAMLRDNLKGTASNFLLYYVKH